MPSHRPEDAPETFFRQLEETYADTLGRETIFDLEIAGLALRIRTPSLTLGEILVRPVRHLLVDTFQGTGSEASANVDLEIRAFDSYETGVPPPARPWSNEAFSTRCDVTGFTNDRFHTMWQHGSGSVSMLDRTGGRAVFWVADSRTLPNEEQGAPLVGLIHSFVQGSRLQVTHAGVVGTDRGGVLLAGRGGSGKSTTALKCLIAGMRYVADDYCLLDDVGRAHALYASAKLAPPSFALLPELARWSAAQPLESGEKAVYFVEEIVPSAMCPHLPIRGLVLARVTDRDTPALVPCHRTEIMKALAVSTVLQLPGAGQPAFRFLARFTAGLPCHILELGSDLDHVPRLLAQHLERL